MADEIKTPGLHGRPGATGGSGAPRTSEGENATGENPTRSPSDGHAAPKPHPHAHLAAATATATATAAEVGPDHVLPESAIEALVAKAEKADEYLALAQRTQADFENYRKRAAREVAAAQERGAAKLALALLPAIDNLERALAHVDTADGGDGSNGTDSLVAGLKHVHSDLIAALGRAGIERYSPEGEPFDPQYHEAVAQQPVEGAEPGVVVEVYQRGYRMGENVVRPARVVVAG
jgi:molecular chaperone GrpE